MFGNPGGLGSIMILRTSFGTMALTLERHQIIYADSSTATRDDTCLREVSCELSTLPPRLSGPCAELL